MGTLSETIENRLTQDIINNVFGADQKLHIKQLAARYGCGSSPIREALSRLVHQELVISVGQRGFRTPPISVSHLKSIVHAFISIATACAHCAMNQVNDEWDHRRHQALHSLTQQCRQAQKNHSKAIYHAQSSFLHALLAPCSSHWLINQSLLLHHHIQRYINYVALTEKEPMWQHSSHMESQMNQAAQLRNSAELEQIIINAMLKLEQILVKKMVLLNPVEKVSNL